MTRFVKGQCLIPILLLWGCSGQLQTPMTPTDVAGRYELLSVGGYSVPVLLPLGGPPRYRVVADTLWLREDSTYEEHMMREVIGPAPLYLVGQFTITGTRLVLTVTDRLETPSTGSSGSPSPNSSRPLKLTVGVGTEVMVYARRCIGTAC